MRGRRHGLPAFRAECVTFWRPLDRFPFWFGAALADQVKACVGMGWGTGDELESLILAQNERWRHA
jgi:hypothetical protein